MAATTRYSKQREAILDLLENTAEHPTAEAIYSQIRGKMPNISLGTVYRNLAFLADSGKIIKIRMLDGTLRFDARRRSHYHLQCRLCGRVEDLAVSVDPRLEEEAERESGAAIEGHDLCFIGVCRECRNLRA
jgi:Fe2+ or Zn2+ uptake regulation protein